MTSIKICGITRLDDAEAAVKLAVHALGFILWPGSPRSVSLDDAARMVAALPPFVTPVGVFVSPSEDDVRRAAEDAGVRLAQIHGAVPNWSGRAPLTILRAVRLGAEGGESLDPPVSPSTPVLLDARDGDLHGGTGTTVDWERAAEVARARRLILAGGLTAANVAEAIQIVRPYGVDVASGVEERPGVKSHLRLRHFVEAVRRADLEASANAVEELL